MRSLLPCPPAAIREAVDQLEVRARIMAFVLATANAALLEEHEELQVVGTVEMAGKAASPDHHKHWAGIQRELGCTAAPGTAQLSMQLRLPQ